MEFGSSSPSTRPLVPSVATASGGALSQLLSGSDAQSELVRGLLDHQLVLTSRSTKAMAFLYAFGLADLADRIKELRRYHQRPAGITKALDAIALKEFMGQLQVQLGNK